MGQISRHPSSGRACLPVPFTLAWASHSPPYSKPLPPACPLFTAWLPPAGGPGIRAAFSHDPTPSMDGVEGSGHHTEDNEVNTRIVMWWDKDCCASDEQRTNELVKANKIMQKNIIAKIKKYIYIFFKLTNLLTKHRERATGEWRYILTKDFPEWLGNAAIY